MSTKTLAKSENLFPSLFDDFFKPWNEWLDSNSTATRRLTIPAVNILEDKDQYEVSLAAPGLKKSNFNIGIEGNILTISSVKEEKMEEKKDAYTRKEYNYTSFRRSFTLPEDVMQDKIEATYEDGVLKLALPKKEEMKKMATPKQIAVK